MAVTGRGQVLKLGAASDAVTGLMNIQCILFDHSTTGSVILTDSASNPVITLRNSATVLSAWIEFPKGLLVDGIIAATMAAGTCTIYLMP